MVNYFVSKDDKKNASLLIRRHHYRGFSLLIIWLAIKKATIQMIPSPCVWCYAKITYLLTKGRDNCEDCSQIQSQLWQELWIWLLVVKEVNLNHIILLYVSLSEGGLNTVHVIFKFCPVAEFIDSGRELKPASKWG